MEPGLRTASAADWRAFRTVRLRALADSPTAFGATLSVVAAHPESVWRDRAAGPGPLVLAFDDDRPVAMGGLYAPERTEDAFVWGMWVEPEWRGRGLGARILHELLAWARRHDRAVSLHVTEANDGARRLYETHGFVSTGEWQPLRDGSAVRMETLRLAEADDGDRSLP